MELSFFGLEYWVFLCGFFVSGFCFFFLNEKVRMLSNYVGDRYLKRFYFKLLIFMLEGIVEKIWLKGG